MQQCRPQRICQINEHDENEQFYCTQLLVFTIYMKLQLLALIVLCITKGVLNMTTEQTSAHEEHVMAESTSTIFGACQKKVRIFQPLLL